MFQKNCLYNRSSETTTDIVMGPEDKILTMKADHKTGTMKRRTITMMMIAHWSALVPRRLEDYQGPKPLRACPPTTLTSLTPANQIQYTRYSLKTKGSSP